jgi:hypothetical protein
MLSIAAFGFNAAGMRPAVNSRMTTPSMATFYDFSATKIDGTADDFSSYKGKPVLILNVASL